MTSLSRSSLMRTTPLLYLLVQSIAIAAQTPACPASIQEKSIHLGDMPPGWTPYVSAPLYLHGAAPMDGPPESLGELADYTERRRQNESTYTYQLDRKFPDGKWLACKYGEGDQVILSQRLDDSIKVCTIIQRKGEHGGENKIAVRCQ